jgi:hypothetical protein
MKSATKPAKGKNLQVVLLRVGIDTGSGGMLGPIFDNGTFEFIPIVGSRDCFGRTYGNTMGRHGRKLIDYFLGKRKVKMQNAPLHFDPEFKSYTYGDPTRPKQSLKKLKRGDLLVLYAGLKGWDCKTPPGLYIVGYFVVKDAGIYNDLKRDGRLKPFAKNWHILNEHEKDSFDRLILVNGGKGSRLLEKAVKISADEKASDRGGYPVFVLDPKMQKHFGNFTELNAIQRSTPRWVKPEFCDKAAAFITELK